MTEQEIIEIYKEIDSELQKVKKKHPDYPVDEFRMVAIMNATLRYHYENESFEDLRKELIQTAVMCVRLLEALPPKPKEK